MQFFEFAWLVSRVSVQLHAKRARTNVMYGLYVFASAMRYNLCERTTPVPPPKKKKRVIRWQRFRVGSCVCVSNVECVGVVALYEALLCMHVWCACACNSHLSNQIANL